MCLPHPFFFRSQIDPARRPTAEELLKHPWLAGADAPPQPAPRNDGGAAATSPPRGGAALGVGGGDDGGSP